MGRPSHFRPQSQIQATSTTTRTYVTWRRHFLFGVIFLHQHHCRVHCKFPRRFGPLFRNSTFLVPSAVTFIVCLCMFLARWINYGRRRNDVSMCMCLHFWMLKYPSWVPNKIFHSPSVLTNSRTAKYSITKLDISKFHQKLWASSVSIFIYLGQFSLPLYMKTYVGLREFRLPLCR